MLFTLVSAFVASASAADAIPTKKEKDDYISSYKSRGICPVAPAKCAPVKGITYDCYTLQYVKGWLDVAEADTGNLAQFCMKKDPKYCGFVSSIRQMARESWKTIDGVSISPYKGIFLCAAQLEVIKKAEEKAAALKAEAARIAALPKKNEVGWSCKKGDDGKREVGACLAEKQCCGSYKNADGTFVDVCNLTAATTFGKEKLPFQCIPVKGTIGYGCKKGADGSREVGACLATAQCCGGYKKDGADTTQFEVCNTDKATKFKDFYTKEYDFICIEGAKNLIASASAFLTYSYMLA